ncbi:MAG: nucleotide pyrophosphohydrolase [Candidatus Micrarchaeaceae archaeon]
MSDKDTTLAQLKEIIKQYNDERDYTKYHDPKELAIGASVEASELLEHFIFKSKEEMELMLRDPKKSQDISDEMADTLYYILRIAQLYDIDISNAFHKKMEQNRKKYPIEKAKGSNKKYNELG